MHANNSNDVAAMLAAFDEDRADVAAMFAALDPERAKIVMALFKCLFAGNNADLVAIKQHYSTCPELAEFADESMKIYHQHVSSMGVKS